jgi:hypothetical protein
VVDKVRVTSGSRQVIIILKELITTKNRKEAHTVIRLHTIERRKANWTGHILRRNCLLKHVIDGKTEGRIKVTGRRGRRRKQLLDDLKEKRGYWKLEEAALDRTVWRIRFGRGYGPVVRQTTMKGLPVTRHAGTKGE